MRSSILSLVLGLAFVTFPGSATAGWQMTPLPGEGTPCTGPPVDGDCSGCGDYLPWADTCWTIEVTTGTGSVYDFNQSWDFDNCEDLCRGQKTLNCMISGEISLGATVGTSGVLTALINVHKSLKKTCGMRMTVGCPTGLPGNVPDCACDCVEAEPVDGGVPDETRPIKLYCYTKRSYLEGYNVKMIASTYESNCKLVSKAGLMPASPYLECECDTSIWVAKFCEPCSGTRFYGEHSPCGIILWDDLGQKSHVPPLKPVSKACGGLPTFPPWTAPGGTPTGGGTSTVGVAG